MQPVLEWFTRKRALHAVLAEQRPEDESAARNLNRARAAVRIAEKALDPREPVADGAAVILNLFAQALHLSLAARSGAVLPTVGAQLDAADPAVLRVSEPGLTKLRAIVARGPSELAERDDADLVGDIGLLRNLCATTIDGAAEREALLSRLRFQRLLRMGALTVVAALAVWLGVEGVTRYLRGPNLVSGQSFRASSALSDCPLGESRTCRGQKVDIFFHTQEQRSPWIEYDLGSPTTLSQVWLQNRSDCCKERAVPLHIEVSDDGKTFRRVARRTRVFSSIVLRFPPVTARYLRLVVDGTTAFHLERVEAYR